MRYLLILMFTLSVSTAMAEPFVCTDVLEDAAYACVLFDADGDEIGSGCFVFDDSTANGLVSADLTIADLGGSILESTWQCGCGASEPEEVVMCHGVGPESAPFTAIAAGVLKEAGDTLVLDALPLTGPLPNGIARCVIDPECQG